MWKLPQASIFHRALGFGKDKGSGLINRSGLKQIRVYSALIVCLFVWLVCSSVEYDYDVIFTLPLHVCFFCWVVNLGKLSDIWVSTFPRLGRFIEAKGTGFIDVGVQILDTLSLVHMKVASWTYTCRMIYRVSSWNNLNKKSSTPYCLLNWSCMSI